MSVRLISIVQDVVVEMKEWWSEANEISGLVMEVLAADLLSEDESPAEPEEDVSALQLFANSLVLLGRLSEAESFVSYFRKVRRSSSRLNNCSSSDWTTSNGQVVLKTAWKVSLSACWTLHRQLVMYGQ